jgi:hypothetical protein
MRILVITSCTGEKRHSPPTQLTQTDFTHLHDAATFAALEANLAAYRTRAEDLYTGQQHLRLLRGLQPARTHLGESAIDLWILSAGYGLIPGNQQIAPYECTFQGMNKTALRTWAQHLQVPTAMRQLLATPYDLALLLLGDSYMAACALDKSVQLGGPTLAFSGSTMAKQLPPLANLRTVVLTNQEAKRFRCGLVALKGDLVARLLKLIAAGTTSVNHLSDPNTDILALLETVDETPLAPQTVSQPSRKAAPLAADQEIPKSTNRKRPTTRANPDVDKVIAIPPSWWEKPHRQKLRYFIPEWDDLVDPDYDFTNETHSGGTGDWANEVYAHQMYPEPNYDGILVSKVVAEKTQKKAQRINALGTHRYVRVPREFPIMGDCGAFGYIMQEVPPYSTAEILDYYTRLDFDYGVSIDHLIVTATGAQRDFRYELTINNADEFLREHKKLGLKWSPIGAVQGWDPASYAKAAKQYVDMGYTYIALGGLVRTNTKEVLRILEEVHQVVPDHVAMHLFGLARMEALPEFARLGVRSVDSASFLRRAWLGTGQNYLAMDGTMYAAIRIPRPEGSFRAKRMISEGRADLATIERLAQACWEAVLDYDKGQRGIEETLDILEEYDKLITENRNDTRPLLRLMLEAAPWKTCPCAICQKDGIQVAIFQGNNRNRRRGFHNTYVFYHFVQRVLNGEDVRINRNPLKDANSLQPALFAMEEEEE